MGNDRLRRALGKISDLQAMTGRRSATLSLLLLAICLGATPNECESELVAAAPVAGRKPIDCSRRIPEGGEVPEGCAPSTATTVPPGANPPPTCPETNDNPCMRYLIPIVGNPNEDLALRAKYTSAFGSACYMSEADMFGVSTFNCFYKELKNACADAAKIGAVSGNAAYDQGYTCQPVGNGDYTLQIGPDVANKLFIYYQAAPRQTPFIDINGTPTEVSGPYRNLPELEVLEPGKVFSEKQKKQILDANEKKHGDNKIHSDLAGYMFPCEEGSAKLCPEPDVLNEPAGWYFASAQVHHVVPMKDRRCCPYGTNSNRNAVVISAKLNKHFLNHDPPVDEVLLVNQIPPCTP